MVDNGSNDALLVDGDGSPPTDGSGQADSAERRAPEIAVPVLGYRNHLGIDRGHGIIRRFTVTHAARHDGSQLGAALDPENTGSFVWGDVAYRGKANVALLERRGLAPQFQRAKPRGRPMPAHVARGKPPI